MYTCIVFLYVTSGIDMQCIYVHLSIVKQIMEAGESIEKTEGVDRYAAMSFAKNTTSEKNSCGILCADRVANTNPHQNKLLLQHHQQGVLCTSLCENVSTLQ